MPPFDLGAMAMRLAAGVSVLCAVVAPFVTKADPAPATRVDPAAMAAARSMASYLRTLRSFEVTSDAVTEFVDAKGGKTPVATRVDYRVRRPNAFVIDVTGPHKSRRFIYNGRAFTVFAPKVGYFATVSAPSTIEGTVERIYDNYGIVLPLADLFYWGTAAQPGDRVTAARRIGEERISGADADHYLYAGAGLQWEVWIQRGPRPLPLKMRIVTTDDTARPAYTANLSWTPVKAFAPDTFAFHPATGAKPIVLARVDR